ncbi:UDP-N-acetylmuramate--L-alanine ligase [Clavibacter michiganensis subsp. michiganensis]|uniref:UDP-N-acetylmuramate--L-alanine ligase n=1 Tax=Clavibacter michiganensis subsp. michiganensis TaxID=33013 RepID=A0A251XII4_CLAMM|nr:UDP-N-acetylmuramate--L-alanine ligase [Clavibacter michiganensis subsp. michiganensis]OUE02612.1 UDP-N-acetylmuramate--L-alanine ligase [Clavibacter michiganensis subsp. michiganensis]
MGDADALVVTGALWQDNPEYVLAKERGLPILHRSQALAWLISGQRLVPSRAPTARPRPRA